MKKSTKHKLAWLLILSPAIYLGYWAIVSTKYYYLLAVIVWLIGDYLLESVHK